MSKRGTTTVDSVIGNRIKARRLKLHVSLAGLAKPLGISFQQLQKYEKGVNRIGIGRLAQVAQHLKTDLVYFTGDLNRSKKPPAPVSALDAFLATADGVRINEAMLRLDANDRRAVIALARTLARAYG